MSALGISGASAQDGTTVNSVLTEDGSLIHGVVSYEENTVAIATSYGETVRIPLARVVRISEYQPENAKSLRAKPLEWGNVYQQGIYTNFSFGFFVGADDASGGCSFATEVGYRFRPELNLGISAGWTYFGDDGGFTLPLKAVIRSEFGKSKVAPVVALGLGYNIPLDGGPYRGFIMTPEAGIVIRGAKRVTHSLTMLFQGAQFRGKYGDYYYYDWESDKKNDFHWSFGFKYSIGI